MDSDKKKYDERQGFIKSEFYNISVLYLWIEAIKLATSMLVTYVGNVSGKTYVSGNFEILMTKFLR